MFTDEGLQEGTAQETPNQSFSEGIGAQATSTPSSDLREESTHHEATTSRIQSTNSTVQEYQPVDMIVENPVFGSGLRLKKASQLLRQMTDSLRLSTLNPQVSSHSNETNQIRVSRMLLIIIDH